MNKIKIKILESATSKGCEHDHLICGSCGSIITMREPKKFNVKRFIALAKKIEKDTKSPVSIHSQKDVNKLPPMILDDDIADWEHDNLVENG